MSTAAKRLTRVLRLVRTAATVAMSAMVVLAVVAPQTMPTNASDSSQRKLHRAEKKMQARADRLVKNHDCWTRQAPDDLDGGLPGHVVMSRPKVPAAHYLAEKWVGIALTDVFEKHRPGVVVHAFCR